ncbi:hypothetical protein GOODEAATRI_006168, partial [Goodea atripinnis]
DPKRKNYMETRLDMPVQQLVDRITEEFSLKHVKLILNGRTLSVGQYGSLPRCLEPQLALILAMGFHEKGRSLMKRKQYDNALCHLLQADQQFSSVDNYAVLQLDIVWCYRALEALSCLEDGRSRLQRAEECFLKCYGEQQQRLLMIKVENLYGRLCPDSEKMAQLMALGFTEREARLGLRACGGDLQEAAIHISNRRQILLDSSQAAQTTLEDSVSPEKVEQVTISLSNQ